jgi:hypothetical protein
MLTAENYHSQNIITVQIINILTPEGLKEKFHFRSQGRKSTNNSDVCFK